MNRPNRTLAAFGGYLADLARLARGVPINPHSLLKFRVLKGLARRTGARTFVETGTFLGVTAARCARIFDRVVTIELDPGLATQAAAYLRRHPNVEVIQGDAAKLLSGVLATCSEGGVVVFLDGHFSGGETALGDSPEPAILELEVLATFRDRLLAVVVDDFRLFGVEPGFPAKAELVGVAERNFPAAEFELAVSLDQLVLERRRGS